MIGYPWDWPHFLEVPGNADALEEMLLALDLCYSIRAAGRFWTIEIFDGTFDEAKQIAQWLRDRGELRCTVLYGTRIEECYAK